MNKRIDYKFKELVLHMLLMIIIEIGCKSILGCNGSFVSKVRKTMRECEAISDGRQPE